MAGIRIGNINEIKGRGRGLGIGRGLGLGQRLKALTTTALDRGQALGKAGIEKAIPMPEPGSLEDDLNPGEQEQFLQGLELALGALQHARGRHARQARAAVQGLVVAAAGFEDSMEAEGGDEYELGTEGVDIIGLDGAGGLVRPDAGGDWR